MRKTVAISLMLCLVFQTFSKSTLIATYAINKQLIVEYFCENTDKVEMHCEGSCFMKKQLKEDHAKESPAPETSRDHDVNLFLTAERISFSEFHGVKEIPVHRYSEGDASLCYFPIFHPPQKYPSIEA